MKDFLKSTVAYLLGLAARAVLHKYRPAIVMVTGSVGKTSTKDAVAAVLSKRFFVRKSDKSFNSEFGVPFTILGVGNPWGNPTAWISIVKSAIGLLFLPNHYPNMLVLEVGADKPGDLMRILRVATPDAVVVTRLPEISVHVEAYASPQAVQEEEFSPAYALTAAAPLIIPDNDERIAAMALGTPARVLTYGHEKEADVRVTYVTYHKDEEGRVEGMAAHVALAGEQHTALARGSVGKIQLLPIAAALATAHAFSIGPKEAFDALAEYTPPAGRGRLLTGINGSILIDDSYNASPVAVEEALDTLRHFPGAKRRIAVLGDMLELGRYSVQEHDRIGTLARAAADVLVTVGIRSRVMAGAAGNAEVLAFDNASAAASALAELVQPGDIILIKGSQSIRTERIVEALLADPADASQLVRQDREWRKRA